MQCWNILQLAPTTDLRAIKKAYAVLLKQNRPDENPAGFQQLHEAYQDALYWADEQLNGPATPPPAPDGTGNTVETDDTSAALDEDEDEDEYASHGCGNPDCEYCAAEAAWEKQLDAEWEVLVQRVEDNLNDATQRNDPAAWQFLLDSEALLDIDFKSAFAMRFLQRLMQLFSEQREQGIPLLQPSIIQWLNQIFWWSERRHHYEGYMDPDLLDEFMLWWQTPPAPAGIEPSLIQPVLLKPSPATPPAPDFAYGNYYRRFLAMMTDWAILYALGFLVATLFLPGSNPILSGLAFILGYPLLALLCEASRLQGTPGKCLFRLKVCDLQQRPPSLPRTALRTLMHSMILSLIAILLASLQPVVIGATALSWLLAADVLMHDRLSGTRVVKR